MSDGIALALMITLTLDGLAITLTLTNIRDVLREIRDQRKGDK